MRVCNSQPTRIIIDDVVTTRYITINSVNAARYYNTYNLKETRFKPDVALVEYSSDVALVVDLILTRRPSTSRAPTGKL